MRPSFSQNGGKIYSHWNTNVLFKHKITNWEKVLDIKKETLFLRWLIQNLLQIIA